MVCKIHTVLRSIMGYPDDLKVLSCMTLFNVADP
ncbi:MAG: DUF1810 family protein [Candidatus Nanosynbacter sp.]|nr:DUF1810 family protein [Candidatus Nanosynbacter sp.]